MASIMIHEGQHADWDRKGKSNRELLENEFISHKFEGLLIDDRGLHTEVPAGSDTAGRILQLKTQQLFNKRGTGWWELKVDSDNNPAINGEGGIYGEVCYLYYIRISNADKLKCKNDHGLRKYWDGTTERFI